MAITSGKWFNDAITRMARETLVAELAQVYCKNIWDGPTDADWARAKAKVAEIEEKGHLWDVLEATAPKPCPECGR